jgi:predicted DNA-binding ribbon-helix-helix protein
MAAGNKRSLTIAGHRTSVSLEPEFWSALADLATAKNKSVAALIDEIDKKRSETGRKQTSLSSAIRLYVLAQMSDARRR